MGFTVIPTNIGGVSLNSLASPLAALLGGTPSAQNMVFPSDLGNNPAMGHAVIFQAYDYVTGLSSPLNAVIGEVGSIVGNALGAGSTDFGNSYTNTLNNVEGLATGLGNVALAGIQASNYTPLTKGRSLATISMFMPETMAINYDAQWGEISLTQELGLPGIISNAVSDVGANGLKGTTPYAKAIGARMLQGGADLASLGSNLGAAALQSMGVFTNPQLQLLYKGVSLRTFQLSFTLTPKTSAEAQTVKNICDSFAYFSLPGIGGAQVGNSGQFLTPPQVFSVQFQFLGGSGIGNQISNAFTSALNTTGLNVLLGNSGTITGGKPSKTFTVNDCVLESVNIDYAPNGWATYNDGYPVQTTLTLQFKETTMYTKQNMNQTAVGANYLFQDNVANYGEMGAEGLAAAAEPMAGGTGWVNGGG